MALTVHEILARPFARRSPLEKLDIISTGRPMPKNFTCDPDVYSRVDWLTGSEVNKAFYCWHCLLFNPQTDEWTFRGVRFLSDEDMRQHESTKPHLQASLLHTLFRCKNSIEDEHSEEVVECRDNTEVPLRIIKMAIYLASQLRSAVEKTGTCPPLDTAQLVDTLRFLAPYEVFSSTSEETIRYLQSTPGALNDAVSSVAQALRTAIKKDVQGVRYVSLVLSSHWEHAQRSLVSTVMRYLKGGQVQERFLGFFVVEERKTTDVIYRFVSRLIEEYDVAEKFVAYSLDGAVLDSPASVRPLVTQLRDDYPFCHLVPCYFHDFNAVLAQSLSSLKGVRQFFNDMSTMKAFFRGKAEFCRVLEEFVGRETDLCRGEWSDARFLEFLSAFRPQVLQFFKALVGRPCLREDSDVPKALAFQEVLQHFETVFLLHTVVKLFRLAAPIVGGPLGTNLKVDLFQSQHVDGFEDLWTVVVSDFFAIGEDSKDPSLQSVQDPSLRVTYREYYFQIYQLMSQEVELRLYSMAELGFFNIFDPEKKDEQVSLEISNEAGETTCRAETPLQNFLAVHGPRFERKWLHNELDAFSRNFASFPKGSVYELLEFLEAADLKGTFRNLTTIAEMILSMPYEPPPAHNPTKWRDVQRWAYIWDNNEVFNDLALVCVEYEFLSELRGSREFLDSVVLEYIEEIDRRQSGPYIIDVKSLS